MFSYLLSHSVTGARCVPTNGPARFGSREGGFLLKGVPMMRGLRLRLACRIKLEMTKSSIVPVVEAKGKGLKAHNWPGALECLGDKKGMLVYLNVT